VHCSAVAAVKFQVRNVRCYLLYKNKPTLVIPSSHHVALTYAPFSNSAIAANSHSFLFSIANNAAGLFCLASHVRTATLAFVLSLAANQTFPTPEPERVWSLTSTTPCSVSPSRPEQPIAALLIDVTRPPEAASAVPAAIELPNRTLPAPSYDGERYHGLFCSVRHGK
jgi:hypothetical protein